MRGVKRGRLPGRLIPFCTASLLLLVTQGCADSTVPGDEDPVSVYYVVKMHEGNPDSVIVRYTEPTGRVVEEEIEPPWRSPTFDFASGDRVELAARSFGDDATLLDCQITAFSASDPDGTVETHGGLPQCRLSMTAGDNPFVLD